MCRSSLLPAVSVPTQPSAGLKAYARCAANEMFSCAVADSVLLRSLVGLPFGDVLERALEFGLAIFGIMPGSDVEPDLAPDPNRPMVKPPVCHHPPAVSLPFRACRRCQIDSGVCPL